MDIKEGEPEGSKHLKRYSNIVANAHISSFRKQERKARRKQKKVNNAINYAKGKKTNKVCISSKDIENVKLLNRTSANVTSFLEDKVLCNNSSEVLISTKTNKKKKRKKNKKNVSKLKEVSDGKNQNQNNLNYAESNNNQNALNFTECTSSLRLAKLQEFVNKESKQMNKDCSKVLEVKKNISKGKLINDKFKLEDLREGQAEDVKQINKYARLIKLNSHQKKHLLPMFEEHFGDILKDIEEGTMDNARTYEENLCDSDLSGNEDALEKDMNFVLGKEEKKLASSCKKSKEVKRQNVSEIQDSDEGVEVTSNEQIDDSVEEEEHDENTSFSEIEDSDEEVNLFSDKPTDDSAEDEEHDENYFLDDEAEEDNEPEENIPKLTNEELVFEAGSMIGGSNQEPQQTGIGLNGLFDLYSSNSEDEGSDLDDFVVDDNFVEYDSHDSGLDDIESKLEQKIKLNKNNKEISTVQTKSANLKSKRIRILSESSDESPDINKNLRTKRRRILSDSIEDQSFSATSSNSKVKNSKKKKKSVRFSLSDNDEKKLENENKINILETVNSEYTEDIYGRLRDKDGNIVQNSVIKKEKNEKYIPPALRKLMELNTNAQKKEQLAALEKKLKGLFNRLAESNLAGIVSQIERLYQTNSRNDMNDSLKKLLIETIVTPVLAPERLVQEHALLIAILSANIGAEVGGHILAEFVCKFIEEWDDFSPTGSFQEIDSKEIDNLLVFITQLYNFKVVDVSLIYDILTKLLEKFDAKAVELILLVLRCVGFTLRKDDPMALKQLIFSIKSKAEEAKSQLTVYTFSKVSFMLEILMAIRNNNMNKVPNYDPTHGEHLKSLMKGIIRKGCRVCDLKISLEDILKSKTCGKWWVVGSAWSGGLKENLTNDDTNSGNASIDHLNNIEDKYSDSFKKKAKKFHLSRPPRINILFALTDGSEDDIDSFQKLVQLNLPPSRECDIFNVMLICNEKYKFYNPFYAKVALRLINYKKGLQRTLQHSLWDKFDDLNRLNDKEIANLASFVADLISEDCLYLSVLKKLDFTSANEKMISFLRRCIMNILLHPQGNYVVEKAFNRFAEQPKMKLLRQCVRIFIVKFVNPKKIGTSQEKALLASKVQLALNILSSSGGVRL